MMLHGILGRCLHLHHQVLRIAVSHRYQTTWSSKAVQEAFVEFYKQEQHTEIRSSSVLPWNDASLYFVNAGMNQFKRVLLGEAVPPSPRVVNSQKCIRVGGKHNDLADVGTDSYHHTFFEMLGSWSFGDYFKQEACSLAWRLLTTVYHLPPDRLYVTYFAGDNNMGIPPDLETRDIWLQIGVPASHILPFGAADNFWEMGPVGPCGPCTEIHYCRSPDTVSAGHLVNAGTEQLIELWNIVFVQYKRLLDGSVEQLPCHHVDTGMGLERLTATLNNLNSNYDTDLFTPIFATIQQESGCAPYGGKFSGTGSEVDTGYRIVADHARMAVVTLADGGLPKTCLSIRKVLQRLFRTAEEQFGLGGGAHSKQPWLPALSGSVSDTLSCRYPEIQSKLDTINSILQHELLHYNTARQALEPAWKELVSKEPGLSVLNDRYTRGLISGLNKLLPDIEQARGSHLPLPISIRLNVEFGIPLDIIEEVGGLYSCTINVEDFQQEIKKVKKQKLMSKNAAARSWWSYNLDDISAQLKETKIDTTNRESVYSYQRRKDDCNTIDRNNDRFSTNINTIVNSVNDNSNKFDKSCLYLYEPVDSEIVAIICNGKVVESATPGANVGIVLRDSNFYAAAGGQVSDRGFIEFHNTGNNKESSTTIETSPSETINTIDRNYGFKVEEADEICGYVIHWGELIDQTISNDGTGSENSCTDNTRHRLIRCGELTRSSIDAEHRLACSRHHTATHLLLRAVQHVAGGASSQVASHVASDEFKLEIASYGALDTTALMLAEDRVQEWVAEGGPVTREEMELTAALQIPDMTLLPGSVYPDIVTVVRAQHPDTPAVELCCGTHVLDVAHLQDFVITSVESSVGVGMRRLRAVCGEAATEIRDRGRLVDQELQRKMQAAVERGSTNRSGTSERTADVKWARKTMKQTLPHRIRKKLVHFAEKNPEENSSVQTSDANVQATKILLQDLEEIHAGHGEGAVVHFVCSQFGANKKILKGAFNIFEGRSHLVVLHIRGSIRARAVLTQGAIERGGSACDWLAPLQNCFSGTLTQGTDPRSLANFNADNISDDSMATHSSELLHLCRAYISKYDTISEKLQQTNTK